MKVAVLDINGKDTGRKVELSTQVFGIEPNDHAIYLDVKQYLANQRQGTHKSKERSEITGSTRKIKKQKVRARRSRVRGMSDSLPRRNVSTRVNLTRRQNGNLK